MSNDMYDALAPFDRDYSAKKSAYLASVDSEIIRNIPDGASSLLDVGAGDGIRGMNIAREKKIGEVVL